MLLELVIDGQDNGAAQPAQNVRAGTLEEALRAYCKNRFNIFDLIQFNSPSASKTFLAQSTVPL